MEKHSIKLSLEEAQRCKNFADSMIDNESQRPYRSNSTINRTPKEMQENIYRGKLAEVACRKFLLENKIELEGDVDFRVFPRGQWDDNYDLRLKELQKRTIDIKASSNKARNLLLEAYDWKYRDGEIFKYNEEPVPSFFLAANVDFNASIVSFKGYLPKKQFISCVRSKRNCYEAGALIPNTNTKLQVANYIWNYDSLMDIDSLIEFLKKTKR